MVCSNLSLFTLHPADFYEVLQIDENGNALALLNLYETLINLRFVCLIWLFDKFFNEFVLLCDVLSVGNKFS